MDRKMFGMELHEKMKEFTSDMGAALDKWEKTVSRPRLRPQVCGHSDTGSAPDSVGLES